MGSFADARAATSTARCGWWRWSVAAIAAAALPRASTRRRFPTGAGAAPSRLAFPLTYWNALGVALRARARARAALHAPAAPRRVGRACSAAAALPVARRRALLHVLARRHRRRGARRRRSTWCSRTRAGWPSRCSRSAIPTAIAVVVAYGADGLATAEYAAPGARRRGRRSSCSPARWARWCCGRSACRSSGACIARRASAAPRGARSLLGAAAAVARRGRRRGRRDAARERDRRPAARVLRDDSSSPSRADQRDRLTRGERQRARSRLARRPRRVRARAADRHRRRHLPAGVGARARRPAQRRRRALALPRDARRARAARAACCSPSRCSCRSASRCGAAARAGAPRARGLPRRGDGAAGPRGDRLGLGDARPVRLVLRRRGPRLRGARRRRAGAGRRPARRGVVAGLGCLLLAVAPASVALSQARARRRRRAPSRPATARPRSTTRSTASTRSTSRPEPFELLGYCNLRAGRASSRSGAMRVGARRATRTTGSTPTASPSRRRSTARTRARWRRWPRGSTRATCARATSPRRCGAAAPGGGPGRRARADPVPVTRQASSRLERRMIRPPLSRREAQEQHRERGEAGERQLESPLLAAGSTWRVGLDVGLSRRDGARAGTLLAARPSSSARARPASRQHAGAGVVGWPLSGTAPRDAWSLPRRSR